MPATPTDTPAAAPTDAPTDAPTATVRVTRRLHAPAERVFDAWLDAASARGWLFATPAGEMVRAEIDPRVGGGFVLVDRRDGVDVAHVGEYLALDRPRRLAFAFGVPQFSPERTRVTVDVVPAGDGCEVLLAHEGVPPDFAERGAEAWRGILAGLAAAVDRRAD